MINLLGISPGAEEEKAVDIPEFRLKFSDTDIVMQHDISASVDDFASKTPTEILGQEKILIKRTR